MLHALSEFPASVAAIAPPTYWYEGRADGKLLRLPRTALAEAVAQALMQQLAADERYGREGKMYGVLLVEAAGEIGVLKAFSGLLNGDRVVAGWVPPLPGREQVAIAEAQTLAALAEIKQSLLALQQIPARSQYATQQQEFETQRQQMMQRHQQRQQQRQHARQQAAATWSGAALAAALTELDEQSRQDGRERRRLKQARSAVLQPLQQQIEQADACIRALKQQRQQLSQRLQAQMHAVYSLTNFAGESLSLQQLVQGGGLPTGTGDCCAPKLLHYAAAHGLKPIAMAEFWWGPPTRRGDRLPGNFYGACVDRCQPLMGFLLSGLPLPAASGDLSLTLLHADDWLIAVDKPAGLLSVPGRSSDRQDSVLTRLRRSHAADLRAAHRLDQDTSGVLLLARDLQTYCYLSQQFEQRQLSKVYEAVLAGSVEGDRGTIDLPLWGDPAERPRQRVDWQRGKPSQSHFRVTARAEQQTRVELMPQTGRTHQLRVHAADPSGLGAPILGDRLYGGPSDAARLHLHAREISFLHPQVGQMVLRSPTPF